MSPKATFLFKYGSFFNNISIANTHGKIRNSESDYEVVIRVYEYHDAKVYDLEKHKPDIIGSMDYLISIIYNATGKNPSERYLEIEESLPIRLPQEKSDNSTH